MRPPRLAAEIDALHDLLRADVTGAARLAGTDPDAQRREEAHRTLLQALDRLDRRLAGSPYALGEDLTAADVDLWVALVELDLVLRPRLDAATADRVAGHDRLRAYVRRLHGHPAFHGNLRADDMARPHRGPGTPSGGGTGWIDHRDGA
ncbi:glutathione S-transferase C-terminal domain-containing protein [Kitasatospora paranensis]|uniref:glutathione S-transferase C-terminal domain-containing protein n=1 Tax=Kitasatospora paranensis TaxID=258053 RepID=UPI0031E9602D